MYVCAQERRNAIRFSCHKAKQQGGPVVSIDRRCCLVSLPGNMVGSRQDGETPATQESAVFTSTRKIIMFPGEEALVRLRKLKKYVHIHTVCRYSNQEEPTQPKIGSWKGQYTV